MRIVKSSSKSLTCLAGKTALVTGANSGIGFNVCLQLASRGCRIIMVDKDDMTETKNEIIRLTNNQTLITKHVDLRSFESVRNLAKDLNKTETKIDILINNAGIGNECTRTDDGLNILMQVNYFSGFLLTHLVLDLLKAADSARIVFSSSVVAFHNDLSLDTLNPEPYTCDDQVTTSLVYGNSKACCILAAMELGEKLKKFGITANAADPGFVNTGIFNNTYDKVNVVAYGLFRVLVYLLSRTGFEGSQTCFHLASSLELKEVTSKNFYNCKEFDIPKVLKNEEFRRQIWEASERIVNLVPEQKIF